MTFSVPLTMKYPPGSNGHSLSSSSSRSLLPRRPHFDDRSMIGMRPIIRFLCGTTVFPFVYFTSTYTGAAYDMSRRRHSCGVTRFSIMSSFTDGGPTEMFV
jgi:hypothetical protein